MRAVTIHILQNIKDAYHRFQKADAIKKIVSQDSAEMIAAQILRRYKNNIEKIHLKQSSYDSRVTELAFLLDMLKGFFLINYKNKVQDG